MPLDPSNFLKISVVDTCSIWNILSSKRLLNAAKNVGCVFCCTAFVQYECLNKSRKNIGTKELELQTRLRKAQSENQFTVYHLDLDSLLDLAILQDRMNLGKGELSSIAFAKQTNQGFITDDQGARKLAETFVAAKNVQTTPLLLGWLIYGQILTDADKDEIVREHVVFNRPLTKYFEDMYKRALEKRLMKTHA